MKTNNLWPGRYFKLPFGPLIMYAIPPKRRTCIKKSLHGQTNAPRQYKKRHMNGLPGSPWFFSGKITVFATWKTQVLNASRM